MADRKQRPIFDKSNANQVYGAQTMKYQRMPTTFILTVLLGIATLATAHEPDATEQALQLDEAAVGSVSFKNSCSAEVQATFNRGIAILHSF